MSLLRQLLSVSHEAGAYFESSIEDGTPNLASIHQVSHCSNHEALIPTCVRITNQSSRRSWETDPIGFPFIKQTRQFLLGERSSFVVPTALPSHNTLTMTSLSTLRNPYLNTTTAIYPNNTALLTTTVTSTSYTSTSTIQTTQWANYFPTITCALPNPYQATYPYAWMTATGDSLKYDLAAFSATHTTPSSSPTFTGCPSGMSVNATPLAEPYTNSSTSTTSSASTLHNLHPSFAMPSNTTSYTTENVIVYVFVCNGSTISTRTETQTQTTTTTTPIPNKRTLPPRSNPRPPPPPPPPPPSHQNKQPPPSLFFILTILLTPLPTLFLLHLLLTRRRRSVSRPSNYTSTTSTATTDVSTISLSDMAPRKRVSFVNVADERGFDVDGDGGWSVGSGELGAETEWEGEEEEGRRKEVV